MDPMSRTGRNCSMALVVFSSPTCHQDESVIRQEAAKKQGKDIRNLIWSVAEAAGKTHLEGRSLGALTSEVVVNQLIVAFHASVAVR